MSPDPCADTCTAVERDEGTGSGTFYVVDHPMVIEFLWTGGNARRAHAALARGLRALGIEAEDTPGMGVLVRKGRCDR